VLFALSEYLNTALFDELREKNGDTYTPEVSYEPDTCSGVFKIWISSSKDPQHVEKRVLEVVESLKSDIEAAELTRLRDRNQLRRRKEAKDNTTLLHCLVGRTLHGASLHDLAVDTVTRDELLAAARKYLPTYRQAYVRLALKGR
jgi:predicted Zn-dependent peptidase